MSNDRHKYRIPLFDDSGKFIGFEDLDILKGLQPYNAGVCHRGEPEQCVGLKDKNGKLIYAGDVVMCEIPGAFRSVEAVVKWSAPGDNRVEWQCKYLNHFEPNRTSKVISI